MRELLEKFVVTAEETENLNIELKQQLMIPLLCLVCQK